MKVICIKGDNLREIDGKPNDDDFSLREGVIYTVIDEQTYKGIDFYRLEERPHDCLYNKKRFIPLSTIDEKEFERSYNKVTA